mmetsp:Transcript_17794/g.40286  ORF Transcript_17794/g.40286 Transcript_17794/m.40286 type:complete len:146 (+) Transcript_17794:199-636(+)
MPKKAKAKGPSIETNPEVVFKHTGFYPGDIIAAPFGTDFELVGVEVRQMWPSGDGGQESEAEFSRAAVTVKAFGQLKSGMQIPLRPTTPDEFAEMGYSRRHEALHILRDTKRHQEKFQQLLENTMPKPKKDKPAGDSKEKGKKKK